LVLSSSSLVSWYVPFAYHLPYANTNTYKIGGAYLLGARFDIALSELSKGQFFPKHAPGSDAAQSVVAQHDGHVEL
jgi:hypothetical protein